MTEAEKKSLAFVSELETLMAKYDASAKVYAPTRCPNGEIVIDLECGVEDCGSSRRAQFSIGSMFRSLISIGDVRSYTE